jgi:hypothetical protein
MSLLPLMLAAALAPVDPTVATVDGHRIPASQLAARADAARRAGVNAAPETLLDGLVDEALMAAEGRRRGVDREPAVARRVEDVRARLAAERLERELRASARVDEAQIRELYHAAADLVRLQQFAFAAREEAAAAAGLLAKEDLAGASRGAIRADREPADVSRMQLDPALAQAAFAAAPGSVAGPVQLKAGWAVAKVLGHQIADEAGLAARRDGLRAFAEQQMTAQLRQHLTSKLRVKANATVDERFIESTGRRLEATPAELERPVGSAGGAPVLYREVLAEAGRIAAGGGGGHASGPSVKKQIAWRLVDERLLQADAIARGLADDPEVQARLAAARTEIVAAEVAAQVAAAVPPDRGEATVRQLVKDLRGRARIEIDAAALKRLPRQG